MPSHHAAHQEGGSDGGWATRHYEVAVLVLAALSAAALLASTFFLLAAAAAPAWGAASCMHEHEPLLGEVGERKRRTKKAGSSKRMVLINGTLSYLVPDQLGLKIRCSEGGPPDCVVCLLMLACRAIWLEAGRVTCDALSRSLSTHSLACDLRHARRLPPCRLLACFVLLLVGRVVNIGLPLAYKKVVDRLAETGVAAAAAASENSASGGMPSLRVLCAALGAAAVPTFKAVFFPWVAIYLALTFLQVGWASRSVHVPH